LDLLDKKFEVVCKGELNVEIIFPDHTENNNVPITVAGKDPTPGALHPFP
jgi:hypothetical protein